MLVSLSEPGTGIGQAFLLGSGQCSEEALKISTFRGRAHCTGDAKVLVGGRGRIPTPL
jgi:hypothetical protein